MRNIISSTENSGTDPVRQDRASRPVHRLLRFASVGICGTLVQYAALWIGVELAGASAALSSGAGYLMGSLVNYLLNYFFTFSSDKSHLDALPKFYIAVGIGWCLNTGLMAWLTGALGFNKWCVQVFATIICFGWNFIASQFWIFRKKK